MQRNATALHCATQQGHDMLSLWLITETEVDIHAENDVSCGCLLFSLI
jgi:hypothetical protein